MSAHLATLREQLAKAETRAEAAEAREMGEGRAEARARAELLQAEAERLRAALDRLTTFPAAALLDRLRAAWRRA